MATDQTRLSRALSAVLTGLYMRRRLTQARFAEMAGMSVFTLQKKLDGKAPITGTDLVIFAGILGVSVDEITEAALSDLGMSTVGRTVDGRRKLPSEMTDDELESLRSAAIRDSELEGDEPPST